MKSYTFVLGWLEHVVRPTVYKAPHLVSTVDASRVLNTLLQADYLSQVHETLVLPSHATDDPQCNNITNVPLLNQNN